MSSDAVLDAAVARLDSLMSLTVYPGAVPDGTLPARYVVVWTSQGTEGSGRMSDATDTVDRPLWVTSVARNTNEKVAALDAADGARQVREAFRDWQMPVGSTHRKVRPTSSQPAQKDTTLTATTYYAAEQFVTRLSL